MTRLEGEYIITYSAYSRNGVRIALAKTKDFSQVDPEDPWEITGYVHNVVFTCGAVLESDGTVKISWGGRRHGHVRGRSECLGSGRTMPASRPTGKVSMAFQESSNTPEWYLTSSKSESPANLLQIVEHLLDLRFLFAPLDGLTGGRGRRAA